MSRRARSLGAVVPIAAVEPDGLMITTAGAYVRLLELERVLQPLAGGPGQREAIRERLGALAAGVPAGQRVQVVVEAEPLDATRALARDWREIHAAAGDLLIAGSARPGALRPWVVRAAPNPPRVTALRGPEPPEAPTHLQIEVPAVDLSGSKSAPIVEEHRGVGGASPGVMPISGPAAA